LQKLAPTLFFRVLIFAQKRPRKTAESPGFLCFFAHFAKNAKIGLTPLCFFAILAV
jgi:hypothetical protein